MSIATEITRLQNAKAALKTSIEAKGVTVSSSAKLDDYPELVDQISGGGPAPVQWLPNPQEYLRFKFITNGLIRWMNKKGDIQYSKNGGTWTAFNGDTISVSTGDEIWFTGALTGGVGAGAEANASRFITAGKFYVSGNVQSLCSFNNTLKDYHFAYLFNNNTGLNIDVSTPLILPATTLASYCYQNMFSNCPLLTTAPELPATTMAGFCYGSMFLNCVSLTTVPEILPATTLSGYCYNSMFYNCPLLTTAPELPATTLANYCYSYMFYGCASLNYIKALFTTTPGTKYTSGWVNCVASTGTFVKSSAATWNVTGVDGVPTGWTVQTAAS